MSLEISSIITEATTCDEITLLDATGSYDVTLNPTGWGAPNPETSDITAAILRISNSSLVASVDYDFFADIADYLSGGLTLSMLDLIGSEIAPDGYYTFSVIITAGGTDYSYTSHQSFFCLSKCCALQKFSEITLPLCKDQAKLMEMAEMMVLFDGMYWAACCGNEARFVYLQNGFNSICSPCGTLSSTPTSGCGCGN